MRTCTIMAYTDGTTSRYAVLRGRMRGGAFITSDAEEIVTYTLVGERPDYAAMTAKHATKDAPPVYWQAKEST
jgi:hypothetical protein